mmetsp:Transcript_9256/g.10720  ORF Transcript_9256/g.10720 Transcript_9256/m.10720 type:complete len:119 (+) Transcript_9256:481-837(+)
MSHIPRPRNKDDGQAGHFMVTFATIGAGLYVVSSLVEVEFMRFLGYVYLIGMAIKVSRKGYNPNYSAQIPHNMTNAQIDTIRAFFAERNKLREATNPEMRQQALGSLRQMSYQDFGNI